MKPILNSLLTLAFCATAFAASDQETAICNRVRFFPRAGFAERMVHGKFQGGNVGPTSDFTDLATVTTTPAEGQWSELRFENKNAFKYLRYFAPPGSWGNVAEVEFYHDNTKLRGETFGTFGSRDESGNTYLKAFDGDTKTFYDAPLADDQYVGIALSLGVAASTAAPAKTGQGRRHYHLGNSLTDTIGEFTHEIAKSAGNIDDFFERSTVPGTPLHGLWKAQRSFGTLWRDGFVKFAPLDDLVFQVFIQNGDSSDPTYSIKIYDVARSNSPNARVWIYGQWASIGSEKPSVARPLLWEERTLNYMPVYVMHWLGVQKARPEARAQVIPGGLALVNLKHAIEAGSVPGMTNFFASNFDDGIHLTAAGRYFIGLVTYSCLYGKSPVGLPVVGLGAKVMPALTPEQAKVYQQIAWNSVTQFQAAPAIIATAVPSEIEARAHLGATPPFGSSADVRYIRKDSTFDYLVRPAQAGAYQLRVSAANGSKAPKALEIWVNDELAQIASVAPTANWETFADTPAVRLQLKAGLNVVRLHVPDERPYNLNSLKFVEANGSGLAHTLPTTDFSVFMPTITNGTTFTNLFSVAQAETPADKLAVTVTTENRALVPEANVKIEAGEFRSQWGGRYNRRLTIVPAEGQTGEARFTLSIKDPDGGGRSVNFGVKVK